MKLLQFSRTAHTILLRPKISKPDENLEQPVLSQTAFIALNSKEDLQQEQLEFLPVFLYPITQHATFYAELLNFNSILNQLNQKYLPVVNG